MWATIGSLLTTLLPVLIKIVLYIIDKKSNSNQLKTEMLKFIANVQNDIPINLNRRYLEQIERIKKQLKEEEQVLNEAKNTKSNL